MPVCIERLEQRRQFAATLPSGFSESILTSSLNQPTSLAELPDGRMLVTQKSGAIRIIRNGVMRNTPVMTLPADSSGERGVLAVVADPNFAGNGYIYVHYFSPGTNAGRVSRFKMTGDTAAASSEKVSLQLDAQTNNASHGGGAIHFGKDGKLYIATGDNEVGANAQSLATLQGKLLRIDADGTIPGSNPFFNTLSGKFRAIYATGLRNPFTFGVDKIGGAIYVNDVGAKAYEEINQARPGANFGWPGSEGRSNDPAIDSPIYAYAPPVVGVGVSIGGGAFYTGVSQQFPSSYAGKYFFGDYVQGTIRTLNPSTKQPSPFASNVGRIIDIDVLRDGSLAVVTYDNKVHVIKYSGGPVTPPASTGTISGYVINDTNANGIWSSGEKGLGGRTVWIDLDNDGQPDASEPTQVTAVNGGFKFTGLAAGGYKIREVVPTGWRQTSPANGFGIGAMLTAGGTKSGISFQVTAV